MEVCQYCREMMPNLPASRLRNVTATLRNGDRVCETCACAVNDVDGPTQWQEGAVKGQYHEIPAPIRP